MSFTHPMPAPRLERVRALWRELQRTPTTSARYQELVALIRAETLAHLTPPAINHQPQPKA